MLDEKTAAVMAYVNLVTEDGGYQVIDADDVVRDLSGRVDRESLRQIVAFLSQREYVSVKYADGDEYCLTALPKGRSVTMGLESLPRRSIWRKTLLQSLPSFLGAAAGAVLVLLLAALF